MKCEKCEKDFEVTDDLISNPSSRLGEVEVTCACCGHTHVIRAREERLRQALEVILKCASAKRSEFPKRMDVMNDVEGKIALVACEFAGDLQFIRDVADDALAGRDWRRRVQITPKSRP